MNVLAALIVTAVILVVLAGPRRWALLAIVAGALYVTQNEAVNAGGFNLWASRFFELAGFLRVLFRREFSFRQMNRIDHALIWLYLYSTVVFLIRSKDGQAYQIGTAVDTCLCYFTFRGLLKNMEDFQWLLRSLLLLLAPYALLVLVESHTGHNPFALLGGIEGGDDWVRNGRPRCFGSFRQPDTLGMFAASFVPLFVGMACISKERRRALFGLGLCLIIAWAANSGAETAATAAGLLCWGFWRYRKKMRQVRWGIMAFFAVLALVMKAPVWYILARASSVTGGNGWHRSYLIDMAYSHIGQWWLAGVAITETGSWFPYGLSATGGADITNQFISFGLTGGLGAMALFVLLLTRAFGALGEALTAVRAGASKPASAEFLLWGLGVMLTVHIINWCGITYFDQMQMFWLMQLAAIANLSANCLAWPLQADRAADLHGQPEILQSEARFPSEVPQT